MTSNFALTANVVQAGVFGSRAQRDYSLMGGRRCQAFEGFARLEAQRDLRPARQVDDLLDTRSAGALSNQNTV